MHRKLARNICHNEMQLADGDVGYQDHLDKINALRDDMRTLDRRTELTRTEFLPLEENMEIQSDAVLDIHYGLVVLGGYTPVEEQHL